jgi:hypothetical protein
VYSDIGLQLESGTVLLHRSNFTKQDTEPSLEHDNVDEKIPTTTPRDKVKCGV